MAKQTIGDFDLYTHDFKDTEWKVGEGDEELIFSPGKNEDIFVRRIALYPDRETTNAEPIVIHFDNDGEAWQELPDGTVVKLTIKDGTIGEVTINFKGEE